MIKSNLSDIDRAIMLFNSLLVGGVIEEIIEDFPKLDTEYTNQDKEKIIFYVDSFYNSFKVNVQTYRPWNPWSAAYATTYTGNYNLIKLNSRKLNRSLASICGTIAHEWGHCLEYYVKSINKEVYFNHGDNSPVGKDYTFQYLLGRRVKRYIDEHGQELLQDLGDL